MKDEYICLNCKHSFKRKHKGWYPTIECPKCKGSAKYKELIGGSAFVKRYKDVTALVFDKKTGQPLWLDKKGNKIRYDSSEIRYDLLRDPRGWKVTGKKVREFDKYGRR